MLVIGAKSISFEHVYKDLKCLRCGSKDSRIYLYWCSRFRFRFRRKILQGVLGLLGRGEASLSWRVWFHAMKAENLYQLFHGLESRSNLFVGH